SVCTLALMLYVTVRLDPQLATVGLAISPVLLVLMRIYRRRLRGQARAVKALDSSAQSVVQEVLAGIRVVKAFGQEIREQERFVSHSRAGIRARLQLAFVENGFGLLVGLTTAGGTAAVVSIGAHHVLSGCYDQTEGQILLDGVDVREYRLADLREQFAIVLQDSVLFSTSIGENISYGRPGASDEEIVAAAKAAGAHDFIVRSRLGYE